MLRLQSFRKATRSIFLFFRACLKRRPAAAPPPQPEPQSVRYKIRKGDSMYEIVERAYGKAVPSLITEVARFNGLKDPGRIRAQRPGRLSELLGRLRIVRLWRTLQVDREYDRRIEEGFARDDWAVSAETLKPAGFGTAARSTNSLDRFGFFWAAISAAAINGFHG